MKFCKLVSVITALVLSTNANATLINVGFDIYNDPYLNAVDYFTETRPMTSFITDWNLLYEDTDGTGTLNIISNSSIYGDISVNDASLTTNNDGSLHVMGTIDFLTLGSSSSFFGDMVITADWDDSNSVTIFGFSPLAVDGLPHNGLFIIDGPLAGTLLEFQVTSSLLAIVDNPFPVYSPVPVPAAAWLFASGLIGLAGFARRKKA